MSALPPEKTCSACGAAKPFTDFHKDSTKNDGRCCWCKVCKNAKLKVKRDADREKRKLEGNKPPAFVPSHKTCYWCREIKTVDQFGINVSMVDGKAIICRPCARLQDASYREENRERFQVERDALRARTPEEVVAVRKGLYGDDLAVAKKKCATCKEDHLLLNYYIFSSCEDGLFSNCKGCCAKADKIKYTKNISRTDEEIKIARESKHPDGTKLCCTCDDVFPLAEFYNTRGTPDGLASKCKSCSHLDSVEESRERAEFRWSLKEGKCCETCGCDNPRMLEFAHLDRAAKYRSSTGKPVGPGVLRPALLAIEVEKTKILCAYCHRLETEQENKAKRSMSYIAIWYRDRNYKIRSETTYKEKLERGHCVDCERKVTTANLSAFDFDHLPEYEKVACLSQMSHYNSGFTYEEMWTEMAKCELRCVNCHRVKTHERRLALLPPVPEED
jgi:hypothetical protein